MYCCKCGAYISDEAAFCPSCGKEVNGRPKEPEYERDGKPEVSGEGDILAILCYFHILLLIPYLMKPNSRFIRYHANQGLILLLLSLACGVVAIIPILGWIVSVVCGIFCFVCVIIGIINVLCGTMKPLPIIGKFELLK